MRKILLLLLLGFGFGIMAQEAPKKRPADEAYERGDEKAKVRYEYLVKSANRKDQKFDIYFIGDSITHGWSHNRRGRKAWAEYFNDMNIGNFGVSGYRTGNVIWLLQNGILPEKQQPKLFVLLIGTNNMKTHTATEIAGGIEAIVKLINQMRPNAKILLVGVLPRGKEPNDYRTEAEEINAIIAKMDNGKTIRYFYFGDKLLNPDKTISPEIMNDFLHLTERGYEMWAEAMKPIMLEMLKEN